jgi:hypothetical protein
MHSPGALADLKSRLVRAAGRLISGRQMADADQIGPCECDACVGIRAARAALAAQRLAACTKSRILLREWLSPEQLAQYERHRCFEVVGSKTGKRYRIQEGRQQNVFELDPPFRGWCFMPEGRLATGDVMLAQKIAIETDEDMAMKVALRFWGQEGLRGFAHWMGAIWGV